MISPARRLSERWKSAQSRASIDRDRSSFATGEPTGKDDLDAPQATPLPHRATRSRTTFLENEALIALRLLILGAVAYFAIELALRIQIVSAAVIIGFAQVSMLWPVAARLRRWRVPAVLAALVCVLGLSAVFVLLLGFVAFRLVSAWPDLVASFSAAFEQLSQWLQSQPFGVDTATLQSWAEQLQLSLGAVVGQVGSYAATGIGAVGTLVTVLVVATFFTLFVLTSGDSLWRGILTSLPDQYRSPADSALRAGMRTAGNWFYASTVTGLVDGGLIGAGLYLLQVPLALPIGALTFVLGYIPMIGATLAGVVAVVVALVAGGPLTALWALLVVLLVQQVEGNVLSPLLLSRAVSFHPAVTLVMTTAAGIAFGLFGLFLVVPVAGIIVAATRAWRRARNPEAMPGGVDVESLG